jgi:hypothetical protein
MSETITAAAHLADLEARMIDGENVTVAELAEARAAVEHEQLAERGRQTRRARKAAEKAAEARAQAKIDAAALLTDHSTAAVLSKWDRARDAIEALLAEVDNHNDAIDQAARALVGAGVPGMGFNGEPQDSPADFDAANHAVIAQGGVFPQVVVDGARHAAQHPGMWVCALVGQVAKAHGDLPLPGGLTLVSRLGDTIAPNYMPAPLVEHLAA